MGRGKREEGRGKREEGEFGFETIMQWSFFSRELILCIHCCSLIKEEGGITPLCDRCKPLGNVRVKCKGKCKGKGKCLGKDKGKCMGKGKGKCMGKDKGKCMGKGKGKGKIKGIGNW